jgi:hypothetical protein
MSFYINAQFGGKYDKSKSLVYGLVSCSCSGHADVATEGKAGLEERKLRGEGAMTVCTVQEWQAAAMRRIGNDRILRR